MMYKIKKSKKAFCDAWEKRRHLLGVLENDKEFAERLY